MVEMVSWLLLPADDGERELSLAHDVVEAVKCFVGSVAKKAAAGNFADMLASNKRQ